MGVLRSVLSHDIVSIRILGPPLSSFVFRYLLLLRSYCFYEVEYKYPQDLNLAFMGAPFLCLSPDEMLR